MKGRGLVSALVRLALAGALVLVGARLYRQLSAPDPDALAELAQATLERILGPNARSTTFDVDLVEGVGVEGLVVEGERGPGPGLQARRVTVRHGLLDLLSGLYRPRALDVESLRLHMHETASGAQIDVPFKLGGRGGGGPVPEIRVRDGELTISGMEDSKRLAPGAALRIVALEGSALRSSDGRLSIRGSFRTRGLGQDDVRIDIGGSADPHGDALDVLVVWDPLKITPELLHTLAPDLAETLAELPVGEGRVEARLVREGGADRELVVTTRWIGAMTRDVGELPGLKDLSPTDKESLRELLGGGMLDVAVERGRLVLRSLATRLGEARVTANGWISPDGDELEIEAFVEDLSLEDPALIRALGATGQEVLRQMTLRGRADARLKIARPRGGELTWGADVTLRDLEFAFHGTVDAEGKRDGFPYRFERGTGRLHVGPEGVRLDGIEGRHGERTVLRVLPSTRTSWQGEETGYVRFGGKDGVALRLTVEAFDMPVDADLEAAVAGSEFAGLLDVYRIAGVIDRVEVDLLRRPGLDEVVRSEVRVTLDDERFRWQRLPAPLDGVNGVVMLRRPPLPEAERVPGGPKVGRTFYVDARAVVRQAGGDAPVTLHAEVDAVKELGRLHVTARGLELGGGFGDAMRTAPLTEGGLSELWTWLAPRGRVDLEADFPLEKDPAPHRILGRLLGVDVTLDASQGEQALRITDLKGVVRAVGDDIRANQITGVLLDAPLEMSGQWPEGGDGPFRVDVRTKTPIPLTSGFLEAVQQLAQCTTLFPYGLTLEPGGQAALDLTILKEPGADCPELPRLMLTDVDVALRWAEGPVLGLQGERLIFEEGEVSAESLAITLPGLLARVADARVGPGGLRGRFDFVLDRFRFDDQLLELLPESTRKVLDSLTRDRQLSSPGFALVLERDGSARLGGDLTFTARPGAPEGGAPRGRVVLEGFELGPEGDPSGQALRGTAVLDGVAFDPGVRLTDLSGRVELSRLGLGDSTAAVARVVGLSGRLEGVRFDALDVPIAWEEGVIVADPITARFADGVLTATLKISTGAPEAYEGRITIRDFDIGKMKDDLAPGGPPLAGRGTLEARFQNLSGKAIDLTASGSLRVRDGRLGELPPAAHLFLALESLLPTSAPPTFERLDAQFTLREEVVHFSCITLEGPFTRLPGTGRLDLAGHVDLWFYPDAIKGLLLPALLPLPGIGPALRRLLPERGLYAVRVHGDISDARTEIVGFPWLTRRDAPTYEPPPTPPDPRRPLPSSFR